MTSRSISCKGIDTQKGDFAPFIGPSVKFRGAGWSEIQNFYFKFSFCLFFPFLMSFLFPLKRYMFIFIFGQSPKVSLWVMIQYY